MRANFLSQGFRELGRKLARSRLRRTIRQQESERLTALTALGQVAWEGKIDLGKHAGLRDRLAGLDARAGEISQESSRLDKDKSALEAQRSAELDAFATRRKAMEAKKSPVDVALRDARSRKGAAEQAIKQAESRLAAIAGRLAALERDIASLGTATGADAQQKITAAQSERAKLVAEQNELGTKLTTTRTQLPAHAAEESRLAAESQKHAAEIAVVDAEQKAAIGRIDADLARLRSELQGATQQSGAVSKDRAGTFGELGKALYDGGERVAALAEPMERVASLDRDRAQSESAHHASLAESSRVPGAAMPKFWGVMLGVPLILAALGTVAYRYAHRDVPVAYAPQPAAVAEVLTVPLPAAAQECPEQLLSSPNGPGVMVGRYCRRTEGQFRDGLLQGKGKITYPADRIEEGDFSRGRLWGNGRIAFNDKRIAEGRFVDGRLSGQGKITWADGRFHEGMFHNGSPAGPGRFRNAKGELSEGMFDSGGKLVGRGIRTTADGTKLYGQFRDNLPFGEVTLVKADGSEEKQVYGTNGRMTQGGK